MQRRSVTVKVPASTSNLGSGFDTLGLAVKLYNRIRVTPSRERRARIVSPVPEGDALPAQSLVEKVARQFFQRAGKPAFGIDVHLQGDVPVARGLGFSSTVRVGILAALNELAVAKWDRQRLLELATELEGHPDNASPAIFGGFTVSGRVDQGVRCLHFPVNSRLKVVTLLPRFRVSTEKARVLVPDRFSKPDTAHALNRAALITAALASGNYRALAGLFDDRVHQPYREQLIPQLSRVIRAGEKAGAIGGFLSGSGSAIICLALRHPGTVARAMHRALPDSEMKILTADNHGFEIA